MVTKFTYHRKNRGFTLVELVLLIVTSSILVVALFAALRGTTADYQIDPRDMVRIAQNASEVFRSWLMKADGCTSNCPVGTPQVSGYIATCDTFPNSSNPVLCRDNLGQLAKYIIQANVEDITVTPGALAPIPAWRLSISVQFFTKSTESSNWNIVKTYNITSEITK